MNGRTGLLLGIMIAQLLVIGLLLLLNSGSQADPEQLLAVDPNAITGITLEAAADAAADEPSEPARLSRSDSGWLIGQRPADGDKVDRLLEQLTGLGPGWPVATTGEARARFAVTEDGFRKRLTLELEDGNTAVLLLGTSPGFKRLHARRPESDAIYSIALGDFDLPAKASDWLDKSLLALEAPVLAASRSGTFEVARETTEASEWQLNRPGSAESSAQAAAENVERWLERFENLRVVEEVSSPGPATPDDVFVFTTVAGELTYSLFHDAAADRHTMARSDVDGYYEVPSYIALQLAASPESLLPAEPAAGETSETAGATDAASEAAVAREPDAAAAEE